MVIEMKKIRSRKGFTLVELVVTVAILSITSSLLVAIVANSINNYSKASITAGEQQIASQIESDILFFAVRSYGTDGVDTSVAGVTVPSTDESAYYVYIDEEGKVKTIFSDIETVGSTPIVTDYSYNGVEKITFQLKKQKTAKDDTSSKKRYVFLEYEIVMKHGYTLKGSVVMGNIPHDVTMDVIDTDSFVDTNTPVVLETSSPGKGLKFKR